MQICKNCSHENNEGAIFCQVCGVALGVISIGTRQLGDAAGLSAGSEKLDDEHVVMLHVQGYDDPLMFQVPHKAILGRTGGETDKTVLINFGLYDAENQGVSRRHAMLTREGDRIYVSDLGSTNHTFLNGQQLQEHDQLVVRDGDELRLGHLNMKVFFK